MTECGESLEYEATKGSRVGGGHEKDVLCTPSVQARASLLYVCLAHGAQQSTLV